MWFTCILKLNQSFEGQPQKNCSAEFKLSFKEVVKIHETSFIIQIQITHKGIIWIVREMSKA